MQDKKPDSNTIARLALARASMLTLEKNATVHRDIDRMIFGELLSIWLVRRNTHVQTCTCSTS